MASLHEITTFLDRELNLAGIPDYSGALNGLQLESCGEVSKVASAVDASLPVIKKAIDAGADLLLVHHGMFWQGAQKVTGAMYQKLKLAMDHELALYSVHIPLDIHPVWGNNVLLAQRLNMDTCEPFFDWKGISLGLKQKLNIHRDGLHERLKSVLDGPVHLCPGGSTDVGVVGIITGGAGAEISAVADCGIDTFITGEGPHWSFPLAEERGINLFYGGHYATETFGVRALAEELASRFALESTFIHHPTGL